MKNEPVFPIIHPDGSGVQYWGMSMKDYFAGQALSAMIQHWGDKMPWNHQEIAKECYLLAYWMVKESEKEDE